jgi:hypothetical protein
MLTTHCRMMYSLVLRNSTAHIKLHYLATAVIYECKMSIESTAGVRDLSGRPPSGREAGPSGQKGRTESRRQKGKHFRQLWADI